MADDCTAAIVKGPTSHLSHKSSSAQCRLERCSIRPAAPALGHSSQLYTIQSTGLSTRFTTGGFPKVRTHLPSKIAPFLLPGKCRQPSSGPPKLHTDATCPEERKVTRGIAAASTGGSADVAYIFFFPPDIFCRLTLLIETGIHFD